MGRKRKVLTVLAGSFWLGTALAHLVATFAGRESDRIEWAERRNLFLLCASLTTNALAFGTAYVSLRSWIDRP